MFIQHSQFTYAVANNRFNFSHKKTTFLQVASKYLSVIKMADLLYRRRL